MRCPSEGIGLGVVVAVLIGLVTAPAHAEEEWLTRSRAILEATGQAPRPPWLNGNPAAIDARRETEAILRSATPAGFGTPSPGSAVSADRPREFVLYVSTSLGTPALKDIFEEARGQDDLLIVFRGVRPGQRVPDFLRELRPWLKGGEPRKPPRLVIDPTRFRAAGVSVVPTLTLEEHGRVLAQVRGLTGLDWFRSKIGRLDPAKSEGGISPLNLGTQGPTREIAEVDLIAEIQRRLAGIDWAARKREALARFWANRTFLELPEATADRERRIDPTVVAPRDVTGPDGSLIVRAGQRVNPLDRLPFRQRLVVFDATRPSQVEAARRLGREADGRRVVFLATRLDREAGWQRLQDLESALGAPAFLLTPDLRDRFGLEFVPSVIDAGDRVFRVREIKPGGAS
jgi:conjugal transfer pilus assembly protein TraW